MLNFIKRVVVFANLKSVLARRRLKVISKHTKINLLSTNSEINNILEVGCGIGNDFIQFINDDNISIIGIDIRDYGLKKRNFKMIVGDAESIIYPDKYFDLTFSCGVLEHIGPVEKLSRIIKEIKRVSKRYIVVVPAISSIIEPHTSSIIWQLRSKLKKSYKSLYYYSDEAWLQFEGFRDAKLKRFYHLPPLITNLLIYKI